MSEIREGRRLKEYTKEEGRKGGAGVRNQPFPGEPRSVSEWDTYSTMHKFTSNLSRDTSIPLPGQRRMFYSRDLCPGE